MNRTSALLADGREVIFFDDNDRGGHRPVLVDDREIAPSQGASELRWDALTREWVITAAHRQQRTHLPPDDQCPLCPWTNVYRSEVPAWDYDVVVFENRFPSLSMAAWEATHPDGSPGRPSPPEQPPEHLRPGVGRCEVMCFTSTHHASFADLAPRRVRTVVEAWVDRTQELSRLPGVEQVFCFENRGREIGVTLSHPHGQIYAYPFITPRTERMLGSVQAHRVKHNRNLFDDLLADQLRRGSRVVAESDHWVAFVPEAARWPIEVHLYPRRRRPDLAALSGSERADLCDIYLDILRRLDGLFEVPMPYVSAWHQAPVRMGRTEFACHLELFSIRRTPHKLKHLAGSESAMGVFINDIPPERAAEMLRQAPVRPPASTRSTR